LLSNSLASQSWFFLAASEFDTSHEGRTRGFLSFYPISYEAKPTSGLLALSFAGGVTGSTALFCSEKDRSGTGLQIWLLDPSGGWGCGDGWHHRDSLPQDRENRFESTVLCCVQHGEGTGTLYPVPASQVGNLTWDVVKLKSPLPQGTGFSLFWEAGFVARSDIFSW